LIRFSVKDTGIGISQPELGKLFKSFSQVGGFWAFSVCEFPLLALRCKVRTVGAIQLLWVLASASLTWASSSSPFHRSVAEFIMLSNFWALSVCVFLSLLAMVCVYMWMLLVLYC
jgi:hypothetical protein